jgi:transposase
MPTRRTFSAAFKAQVVLEVLSGIKSQAELAREHQLKPDLITRWKRQFLENVASVFEKQNPTDALAARIAELERVLGRKTMELEIAKKASSILNRLRDGS